MFRKHTKGRAPEGTRPSCLLFLPGPADLLSFPYPLTVS